MKPNGKLTHKWSMR